jgi:proline dehydrogenase
MQLLRSSLLWASQSPRMERLVRSSRAMRPLVSRFMPGESQDAVIAAVRALRDQGVPSIVTYLGENVTSDDAADQTLAEYERLMESLSREAADAHVSVKLTQFGWDVDQERALERVRRLVQLAEAQSVILAIDMESSAYVESTVAGYERLRRTHANVALCVQAYLHRTPADLQRLLPLAPYVRLVKGAYREPADVALSRRADVDSRYSWGRFRQARAWRSARTTWRSFEGSGRTRACLAFPNSPSRFRCCTASRMWVAAILRRRGFARGS